MSPQQITLSTWQHARSALRNRYLRQGLYDEGTALMSGVIVNLHDAEHTARRRLENRLFRRDTFAFWEQDLIPHNIAESISTHLAAGSVDLLQLARLTMMRISAGIAGIDLGTDPKRFVLLAELMSKLARASSVNHFIGDKQSVIDDGNSALAAFEAEFFSPAKARRMQLLQQVASKQIDAAELPKDVLMTLLSNQDNLSIPDDTVLREIAYFPWVGSHSTSGAFVNLMDHIFEWLRSHPEKRTELANDIALIQRFGFESLRLHPASPESVRIAVTDTVIEPDVHIEEGGRVVIDMQSANRDPLQFGSDANEFNPYRSIPSDISPWGLSFGSGFHACIGQELVSGLEQSATDTEVPLTGAIATMAQIVLQHGAIPDPARPAKRDAQSLRQNWLEYPVIFRA
jgi:cytochrome P450